MEKRGKGRNIENRGEAGEKSYKGEEGRRRR